MGPQPTVSLPYQPMAKIWVLTAGCAPGTNTTLTFTAGNATVQADPQTLALQTAPAAAVMTSPPPGATIPSGPASFQWNAAPGVAYTLALGHLPGGTDYRWGPASSPASVTTLPASGPVYATLGTQTATGWLYEQCVYTVNATPSTAPLVVSGTTLVQVPNNMAKVRGTYYFSSGDATTIASVSTNVTGLTATVVGVTPNTATIEFRANGGVAKGVVATVTAKGSGGGVLGALGGEETVGGPTISVSPGEGAAGTQFSITETDGIAPAGPATPATLLISGDCPYVEADWQDYGFPGYPYYSPSTVGGNCTAQLFLSGDYAIALGMNETDWVWSDLMGFTVTAAAPPGATAPTIDGISFATVPVAGTNGDTLTITGSFGASGFVEACRSGSNDDCIQPTSTTWGTSTIQLVWNIPTWAAGITYCVQVTTQFAGGGALPSICSLAALFYVPATSTSVRLKVWTFDDYGNPVPVNPGDKLYINKTPTMPYLQAQIVGANGQAVQNGTATWILTLTFPQYMSKAEWDSNAPEAQSVQIPTQDPPPVVAASAQYQAAWGTNFVGGDATLNWTYDSVAQPAFSFLIRGANPDKSAVAAKLVPPASPYWFANNIAIHETRQSQFCDPVTSRTASSPYCQSSNLNDPPGGGTIGPMSMPIYGFPAGYGVMQLDPPQNYSQIWNWQANVQRGITNLSNLAGNTTDRLNTQGGYGYWNSQVRQWQRYNQLVAKYINGGGGANQLAPVGPPEAYDAPTTLTINGTTNTVQTMPIPNCQFIGSYNPSTGLSTPSTSSPYWYGDAVVMKQNAGTVDCAGVNANYISWGDSGAPPTGAPARWYFHKATKYSGDIAYEFCACGTACLPSRLLCPATPGPLTVTTTSLPDAKVGAAYSVSLAASGGVPGYGYTWALSAGSLPSGMTFSTSGLLSGTPSAAGTFGGLVFYVADSAGGTASRTLTLAVAPAN